MLIESVAPSSPNDFIPRVAGLILLICAAVGVYGQIYRYVRMATQPQRQQIKWLALGALGIFASALIGATFTNVPTASGNTPIEARLLAGLLVTLGFCSFPIALMFAILRHRLWEIDLVLNRTFVYGGLTASASCSRAAARISSARASRSCWLTDGCSSPPPYCRTIDGCTSTSAGTAA